MQVTLATFSQRMTGLFSSVVAGIFKSLDRVAGVMLTSSRLAATIAPLAGRFHQYLSQIFDKTRSYSASLVIHLAVKR